MQLANQASQLSVVLAADSRSSGITRFTLSVALFTKYGHFCFQKTKKSKLKASKQPSTKQCGPSPMLRPLLTQSVAEDSDSLGLRFTNYSDIYYRQYCSERSLQCVWPALICLCLRPSVSAGALCIMPSDTLSLPTATSHSLCKLLFCLHKQKGERREPEDAA